MIDGGRLPVGPPFHLPKVPRTRTDEGQVRAPMHLLFLLNRFTQGIQNVTFFGVIIPAMPHGQAFLLRESSFDPNPFPTIIQQEIVFTIFAKALRALADNGIFAFTQPYHEIKYAQGNLLSFFIFGKANFSQFIASIVFSYLQVMWPSRNEFFEQIPIIGLDPFYPKAF